MTWIPQIPKITLIIAALAICMQAPTVFAATKPKPPLLFGSLEMPKVGIQKFKRWTGMLKRVKNGKALQAAVPNWETFITSLKGKSPFDLIKTVNTFVNKIEYQTDPTIWRNDDFWATPEEFYKKTGDCEDYAITKYMILKDLGVDPNNMRIVVVKDLNLKEYHALLAIYTDDGHILILDNQVGEVMLHTRVRHYKVMYSINEKQWWRHL